MAVLIGKAIVEIPPRFAGKPPVNPTGCRVWVQVSGSGPMGWQRIFGYYGRWMRERAFEQIGHLYPKVRLPASRVEGRRR